MLLWLHSKSFVSKYQSKIGHFQKYHNTLCLSSRILHNYCFYVSLGIIVSPRRKQKQCLCKILDGQTKSVMVFLKVDYGFVCHSYLCSENKNSGDLFKRLTNFSNPLSFFVLKNIFSTLEKKFRISVRSFNSSLLVLQVVCNQSLGTKTTMLQCAIAAGRTKAANQKSFVFVHQHGSYDVT